LMLRFPAKGDERCCDRRKRPQELIVRRVFQ